MVANCKQGAVLASSQPRIGSGCQEVREPPDEFQIHAKVGSTQIESLTLLYSAPREKDAFLKDKDLLPFSL